MACLHGSLPAAACGSWACPWSCSKRGGRGACPPPTPCPTTRGHQGRTGCHPCSDRVWQPHAGQGEGAKLGHEHGLKSLIFDCKHRTDHGRESGNSLPRNTDGLMTVREGVKQTVKKCVGPPQGWMMARGEILMNSKNIFTNSLSLDALHRVTPMKGAFSQAGAGSP